MEINAITQVEAPSRAEVSSNQFADNFDDFLKIFITQLQNQDPLAPQDSNAFTEQIAIMSGVEQAVNTNKNLETLIALVEAQNDSLVDKNAEIGTMASFVGKNVKIDGGSITLEDGKNVNMDVVIEDLARGAFITVTDSNGNTVFTGALEPQDGSDDSYVWNGNNTSGYVLSPGTYASIWDGTDSTGSRLPAGTYNVSVTAELIDEKNILDSNGRVTGTTTSTTATTLVNGHVSGVNLEGEELTLLVNGGFVPLTKVTFIGE